MGRTDHLQVEQEHHIAAFERYYALGESRSYEQVAQEMKVSVAAVKLWGRSFDWQKRVHLRDIQSARRIADQTFDARLQDHEHHRKLIRLALARLAKAIADGSVRMQLSDLDRLIRLDHALSGKPLGDPDHADPLQVAAEIREIADQFSDDEKRFIVHQYRIGKFGSMKPSNLLDPIHDPRAAQPPEGEV